MHRQTGMRLWKMLMWLMKLHNAAELTAEYCVEVRGALRGGGGGAAAGGASVHSLQCCDVGRPLSPHCSVRPHVISFARAQSNTH